MEKLIRFLHHFIASILEAVNGTTVIIGSVLASFYTFFTSGDFVRCVLGVIITYTLKRLLDWIFKVKQKHDGTN